MIREATMYEAVCDGCGKEGWVFSTASLSVRHAKSRLQWEEVGGCCARCRAEGRSGTCHGQACSLPSRGHDGQRWETWLFVVAVHQPRLKRFLPRKYWKHVNEIRRKYYGTKQRERGRKEI